jgi:hypothetical protein
MAGVTAGWRWNLIFWIRLAVPNVEETLLNQYVLAVPPWFRMRAGAHRNCHTLRKETFIGNNSLGWTAAHAKLNIPWVFIKVHQMLASGACSFTPYI